MTIASTLVAAARAVGLTKKPTTPQGLVSKEKYEALLMKHLEWASTILGADAPYQSAAAKLAEVNGAIVACERDCRRGFGREFITPFTKDALGKLLEEDLLVMDDTKVPDAMGRANAIIVEFITENAIPLGEPTRDIQVLYRQRSLLQKAVPILENRRNEAQSAAARRAIETIEAHYAPIVQRNAKSLRAFAEDVAEELAFCEAMVLSDLSFQPIYFSHLLSGNDGITNPEAVSVKRINEARERGFIE